MPVVVEFVGKSRREYTKRNGQPGVAHNVTVLTDEGQAGELFVSEPAYQSLNGVERGQRLALSSGVQVYQGKAELRVTGFQVVK